MQSDGELANALGRVPVQILIRAKTNQNHRPERVSVPRGIGCVAQKENAG